MDTTKTSPPASVVLSTRGLSKDYGPVRVVADISLDFRAGSIHALLGENGAGKSTLIKMLSGATLPSEGAVLVDDAVRTFRSVRDGQAHGVVALPQELTLVPTLGAAENIFLGTRRAGSRVVIDRRRLDRDARAHLAELGQDVPMDVPVGELSAVQQTMIALARALARNARVLILDEPTAALTDTETEQLFTVLRALRDAGTSILYVSHRLEEVFALADTATVMRNGRHVWTKPIEQTDTDDVVAAMIGRTQEQLYPHRATHAGELVLEVSGVHGYTVRGVSMSARAGRVLGIAGLAGAGRSELLKIIAGAEAAQGGTITLDGRDLTRASLSAVMDAGVVLVPEERRSEGLVMTHSIQTNIALANLRSLSTVGVMSAARERSTAERRKTDLQIKATSVRQAVDELSGGNQQKVVLAKYLERSPRVLLLDEPTRGIDIGTKAEIYHLVRGLADDGVAVIVVSSEIPELLGIADEIAVLHEGHLTGFVGADEATEESILHLCYRKPE
ncbi:sugar ABC transporter ATP-binding protein [Microbacterium aquimaris]|uniref:sugar ABC transporter ATP-binding protein n=1 Tax=Microbacterium aquimaris TaxID=459816 RepID=UPI002AD39DD8|nr:sugar ABC transporter ATP-binding protein [Microbacterium aquimaris]MDZ8274804.1 sugar ABC transporter ATP-binding protein [Microbacterium aquimaris]